MKLRPGTPLNISLLTGDEPTPVARLAMAGGVAQLEWTPQTITRGRTLSPLYYPPTSGLHPARSHEFDGLHGFLADSLPDAWGILLQRRRLEKLGHDYGALNAVDRLALVGKTGRGALIFEPETLPDVQSGAINLDDLAVASHNILQGEEGDLDALITRLGGGSGGARPKLHIGIADDGTIIAGDIETANHAEYIVKFPALNDPADIGPTEQAYAQMARMAGIIMADSKLIPSAKGHDYFASRRFDRINDAGGIKRIHMVSLGGALEADMHVPSMDYDGFMSATVSITRDMRDVEQVFTRMIFNILSHNRDDHVRQHAYLMDDDGHWRLSPAYDLTFADGPGGEHYMSVEGEGKSITHAHVMALGLRHGISAKRIGAIVSNICDTLSQWNEIARDCGVTISRTKIAERLKAIDKVFKG